MLYLTAYINKEQKDKNPHFFRKYPTSPPPAKCRLCIPPRGCVAIYKLARLERHFR